MPFYPLIDLNECNSADTNKCQQKCENTDGSYKCACNPGYKAKGQYECEGRKKYYCISLSNHPYLYYHPPPNFGKSHFFCLLYLMFMTEGQTEERCLSSTAVS